MTRAVGPILAMHPEAMTPLRGSTNAVRATEDPSSAAAVFRPWWVPACLATIRIGVWNRQGGARRG
jgi:hypothetical protein